MNILFQIKNVKREEFMNEENNQIINEELEVNPIYPKLIQIEI